MLKMVKALSCVALCTPLMASANYKSDLAKIDADLKTCMDSADSNLAMKVCQGNAWTATDQLLNTSYQQWVANLKQQSIQQRKDGLIYQDQRTFADETLSRMIAAERAWIAFRDSECSFEATQMLGGTGEGLVWSGCVTELTKQRIIAINETLNSQGQ